VRDCGRSVNCSDVRLAALSHGVVQLISKSWHGSESVDCESEQQVFHVGGQKVMTRKEGRKQASRRLGGSTEPAGEGDQRHACAPSLMGSLQCLVSLLRMPVRLYM
jgi:hypothetical protein